MPDAVIPSLTWVRRSKQTRSQATQQAIMDATASLCAQHGVAQTAVKDIAVLANCSVGSLYNHFRDKDGLVKAVCVASLEHISALTDHLQDTLHGTAPSARVVFETYLDAIMSLHEHAPGYCWVLNDMARQDEEIRDAWIATQHRLLEVVGELMMEHRDDIGHSDPACAVSFVLYEITLLVQSRFSHQVHPRPSLLTEPAVFQREICLMVEQYLKI